MLKYSCFVSFYYEWVNFYNKEIKSSTYLKSIIFNNRILLFFSYFDFSFYFNFGFRLLQEKDKPHTVDCSIVRSKFIKKKVQELFGKEPEVFINNLLCHLACLSDILNSINKFNSLKSVPINMLLNWKFYNLLSLLKFGTYQLKF